jgi:hypothetical protein
MKKSSNQKERRKEMKETNKIKEKGKEDDS